MHTYIYNYMLARERPHRASTGAIVTEHIYIYI